MTSRERVLKALRHEEPDRVPLALGGSAYNMCDEVYFNLLKYLGLPADWPTFRNDGFKTSNYLDDRVLAALGVDFRYIYQPTPDLVHIRDGLTINGWGSLVEKTAGFTRIEPTLATATRQEIESYPWPDPQNFLPLAGMGERAKAYREAGFAVVGRSVCSYGILEQGGQLRGTEQFMVDLMLDESLAQCLVDHIGQTIYDIMEVYLAETGEYLDMIELPGDDYGSQAGPLISPALFKRYFQPWFRKMADLVKSRAPQAYVLAHSDGFITPFLPGYIEAGVDVIHPLQPGVGMDLGAIKREFGRDLSFVGALDIQQALPAGPEAAVEEVKTRLAELAAGGGYILAPSNHFGSDISPETIVAVYQAAGELGKY